MKLKLIIGLLLITFNLNAAEQMPIKGELTFNDYGIAIVAECKSDRIIEFGVMASAPYFVFSKKYDEISYKGTKPILVEVEGNIILGARTSSGPMDTLILEYPNVLSMTPGSCNEAPNKAPQLTHKSVAPIVAMLLAPTELERYVFLVQKEL